jgi:F-type H+-transporting ATPase subunit epsilon
MKNHRNGIIALDVGEIKVETKDDVEWYATSGGFVEILNNKVELLLESVERSNEIDVKRASGALERAGQRRKNTKESIDNMRLEASLLRAVNRLRVSKK